MSLSTTHFAIQASLAACDTAHVARTRRGDRRRLATVYSTPPAGREVAHISHPRANYHAEEESGADSARRGEWQRRGRAGPPLTPMGEPGRALRSITRHAMQQQQQPSARVSVFTCKSSTETKLRYAASALPENGRRRRACDRSLMQCRYMHPWAGARPGKEWNGTERNAERSEPLPSERNH